MFIKCVVFALLAAFVLQGVVEAQNVSHPVKRNVIKDIGKLLKKLENLIENAIKSGVDKVKKLIINLKNVIAKLLENAKTQFEEELLKVFKVISKLEEEAKDLEIDVSECTVAHKKEITALKDKALNESIDCVNKEIKEAQSIVDVVVSEINAVKSFVTNIKNKVKKCRLNLFCYASLIKDVYKLFTSLPGNILQLVAKASNLVVNIQTKLPLCVSTKLLAFVKDTKPIVTEVGKCVSEKIGKLYY